MSYRLISYLVLEISWQQERVTATPALPNTNGTLTKNIMSLSLIVCTGEHEIMWASEIW